MRKSQFSGGFEAFFLLIISNEEHFLNFLFAKETRALMISDKLDSTGLADSSMTARIEHDFWFFFKADDAGIAGIGWHLGLGTFICLRLEIFVFFSSGEISCRVLDEFEGEGFREEAKDNFLAKLVLVEHFLKTADDLFFPQQVKEQPART